ncbi:MAG TPA: patatin-like phospholipase family protein [Solirubrobacterales bacterium]|jgi:NTE family protein|nr:patatin-like phospholipase family protein [Solirubrobacterales bacterium]
MAQEKQSDPKRVDLVLEGGGVKGIGLVGALAALDEHGFAVQSLAGTSAGAIAAALIAADYSVAELRKILTELDFESFKDEDWEDRIPVVGMVVSALTDKGIYEGERLRNWIAGLLAEKQIHTFADLVDPKYADEPEYRYRLQVIATDITAHELLLLPRDAKRFGIDPDELSVADAVRMSMSIPLFFEPWRWRSQADGREHLIVDGGVLSNFPVWIFDSEGEPPWPTFGLTLVEPDPQSDPGADLPPSGDTSILTYLKDLVSTMLEAHDRMYLQNDTFVRTIPIPTLGVRTTEFDLSTERANALYDSGHSAAEDFLSRWDFDAYKATFRAGERPTRREAIARLGAE